MNGQKLCSFWLLTAVVVSVADMLQVAYNEISHMVGLQAVVEVSKHRLDRMVQPSVPRPIQCPEMSGDVSPVILSPSFCWMIQRIFLSFSLTM